MTTAEMVMHLTCMCMYACMGVCMYRYVACGAVDVVVMVRAVSPTCGIKTADEL